MLFLLHFETSFLSPIIFSTTFVIDLSSNYFKGSLPCISSYVIALDLSKIHSLDLFLIFCVTRWMSPKTRKKSFIRKNTWLLDDMAQVGDHKFRKQQFHQQHSNIHWTVDSSQVSAPTQQQTLKQIAIIFEKL